MEVREIERARDCTRDDCWNIVFDSSIRWLTLAFPYVAIDL